MNNMNNNNGSHQRNNLTLLLTPYTPTLRENDTTIHWTLVALRDFGDRLEREGLYIDDLSEAAQELESNLNTTISIRVYDYTGVDTANFSESEIDPDPDYFKMDLVNDIVQAALLHELDVRDANALLSNMDKLDLKQTREIIDKLIAPHFPNIYNEK